MLPVKQLQRVLRIGQGIGERFEQAVGNRLAQRRIGFQRLPPGRDRLAVVANTGRAVQHPAARHPFRQHRRRTPEGERGNRVDPLFHQHAVEHLVVDMDKFDRIRGEPDPLGIGAEERKFAGGRHRGNLLARQILRLQDRRIIEHPHAHRRVIIARRECDQRQILGHGQDRGRRRDNAKLELTGCDGLRRRQPRAISRSIPRGFIVMARATKT